MLWYKGCFNVCLCRGQSRKVTVNSIEKWLLTESLRTCISHYKLRSSQRERAEKILSIANLESLTNMVNNEDTDKIFPLSMSRGYVTAPTRNLILYSLIREIYMINI